MKKRIEKLFKKAGISKKESAIILAAIYANPFVFIPTVIAGVYIAGRIIFILFKRKRKPQEL